MKRNYINSVAAVLALFIAANALALEKVEGLDPDKYSIEMQDDKIVRLNKQTGEITFCSFENDELICRIAQSTIETKDEKNARLEKRIEKLEALIEASPQIQSQDQQNNKLDDEVERAIEYSSKVMRRFFTVMKDLKKDLEKDFN